jgi:N-acetylglucosamine kinase-like BadF-type ATPase
MKIIADSGSTKTNWVITEGRKIVFQKTTPGFNPVYYPGSVLDVSINEIAPSLNLGHVNEIYYYGTGCSSTTSNKIVQELLRKHFTKAKIEVNGDLFGAARALFGNEKGIASILGTGSSSCIFENHQIVQAVPSLGYLLADEGSGAHLGKLLLNAFFKNDLPPSLHEKFARQYGLEPETFIPQLYAREKPNTYIASFVPFIIQNKKEPFIAELIINALYTFFQEIILKYPNYQSYDLGFAGSVAFIFKDFLSMIAEEFNLSICKIIQNPIDDLVKFHMED